MFATSHAGPVSPFDQSGLQVKLGLGISGQQAAVAGRAREPRGAAQLQTEDTSGIDSSVVVSLNYISYESTITFETETIQKFYFL